MRQVRNRVQRLAKDQRGFTMLELLMVMFIVGTLAGLGVSTYSGMAQRRDVARADVLWRSLSSAVAMYQMTHEGFRSRPVKWCKLDSSVQVGDYRSGTPSNSLVPSCSSLR